MSEHITHVAVYEDCARLIKADKNNFPGVFVESIEKGYDCGLFCSGTRGNHLNSVPIIEKYKNRDKGSFKLKELEQIAGAIGWITHRASDLQMKPLFKIIEDEKHPVFHDNECQMYHDAIVFKEVYLGGTISSESIYEPFSPATLSHDMNEHPVADKINVPVTEQIFTHYFLGEYVKQHDFFNEMNDVDEYLDLVINNSQDLYEDLRVYINAFQNPEHHKLMEYIYNYNVYDQNDSLIQIVRDIQLNNKYPSNVYLKNSLNEASQQSQYAQALKKGYDFVMALADFYQDKKSKDDTYDFLSIFTKSHRI